jgi:hypothetical protein
MKLLLGSLGADNGNGLVQAQLTSPLGSASSLKEEERWCRGASFMRAFFLWASRRQRSCCCCNCILHTGCNNNQTLIPIQINVKINKKMCRHHSPQQGVDEYLKVTLLDEQFNFLSILKH